MREIRSTIVENVWENEGLATVEWILLLGVIIIPMVAFIFEIMNLLERYYAVTSWIVSLPFP